MKPTKIFEVKVPNAGFRGTDPVTVLEWHVNEGESILRGQAILDLITSRGLTTLSALTPGRVTEILVEEGTRVDRGQTLALIIEAD